EELLTDALVERRGFIRTGAARELLAQTAARGFVPNQLWYIFVLETWLRHEQDAAASMHDATTARTTIARDEIFVS
ncbi:MAG TPA: hypothetical protein VE821_00710, partial [Pyrinomonadaceae bacterium]|nr:hypothetical protein [Pyrinomonadaceae bacterium]